MRTPLNILRLGHVRPPVRRVLAVDAGSRRLKLLLAESDFGRLRLLKREMLDLQAEGLVAADELKAHLQTRLEAWGKPAVALVLPQHVSISQVIDLPAVPDQEVEKLIADEIVKLSGVSESRIVYDFVRTESAVQNRQQFWVTLSQEGDIRERISKLGLENEDLCEVTTTANALVAAYRAANPLSSRAILVHLGAQTTVVVILMAGQGVYAASFQMGGDFFTRALARLRKIPEDAAEAAKQREDWFSGSQASAGFLAAADGWVAELRRQLQEGFRDARGANAQLNEFELIASGGGFEQPGLLDYLSTHAGLKLKPWPEGAQAEGEGFEVATGAALQALGYSPQPVSLLPDQYRLAWKKRLAQQRIEVGSWMLAILCLVCLAIGTWQKISIISAKQALLTKVWAAQEAVDANDALTFELAGEYENLRPLLADEQNTLDTLRTLSLLQQSRSNRNLWYVLFADQQSYFNQPPALLATNRPVRSNLLASLLENPATFASVRASSLSPTNAGVARPGFIAELCVPGEAEPARQVLSELVAGLKEQPLFSKVDLLSDDLRRSLAEPRVVVPARHFVLALDFATQDFQQAIRWKRLSSSPTQPTGSRRAPRTLKAATEDEPVAIKPRP